MYSLLISHLEKDKPTPAIEISKSRFLEYTSDAISNQLESLSVEAIDCIKSWPCILMQEGRGQEVAHIVQITALQVDAGDIKLIVTPIAGSRILVNDAIWKLRTELDIAQFEFNRNHWAFKDRELFAVLAAEGYAFSGAESTISSAYVLCGRRKARRTLKLWITTEGIRLWAKSCALFTPANNCGRSS